MIELILLITAGISLIISTMIVVAALIVVSCKEEGYGEISWYGDLRGRRK